MIHPTSIIRGDVTISESAIVEPYAIITGPCTIGANAYIGAHATIGAPGQHHGTYPAPLTGEHHAKGVTIGPGACVREYATIHQGILITTSIGADTLLMAGTHIAHDCEIGNGVTLGSFSILGGFTSIGDGVTFGQGVVTHPWVVIGENAMIGLNSSVLRDVDPYAKIAGAPARTLGINEKKLGDTILSADVWEAHAATIRKRDERKADWYAK